MSTDKRIDRVARRLARPDAEIYDSGTTRRATVDTAFEGVARVLATPFTRRRAVALFGAAVATSSLLRPSSASADCFPGGPKVCEQKGRKVCVPDNLACCSNDNCAIACPYPWRICESPANCADTARMCTDPSAPGYQAGNTKFCSMRISVTNGCMPSGTSMSLRGWCCGKNDLCGAGFGDCVCAKPCGDDCCKKDQECVDLGLLRGKVCKPPCKHGFHYEGDVCVCDKGQTCGLTCCPAGTVCLGSSCVKPNDSKKLPSLFDAFDGFFDTASQSASSHGGASGSRFHSVVAAQAGGPVEAALLALASVNAQGNVAAAGFSGSPVDRKHRRKVVAAKPSPPRISSGPGLAPAAAQALEALLAAEAKGFALAIASGTALARARGAVKRHDLKTARKQTLASAGFAERAARALRPVPKLRGKAVSALRTTGTSEVVVSPAQILALQTQVQAGGVPADLRGRLRHLGVGADGLAPVRAALLAGATGGPTLIAPLADPARTRNLTSMAHELAHFAKSARRTPISRSHGKPKRYRPRAASAREG